MRVIARLAGGYVISAPALWQFVRLRRDSEEVS